MTVAEQMEIIRRGAVDILLEKELEEKLEKFGKDRCSIENQGWV